MRKFEGDVARGFYSSWVQTSDGAVGMSEAVEGHDDGQRVVFTVEAASEHAEREEAIAELVEAIGNMRNCGCSHCSRVRSAVAKVRGQP